MFVQKGGLIAAFPDRDDRSVDKSGIDDALTAHSYVFGAEHVGIVADETGICEIFGVEVLLVRCVIGGGVVNLGLVVGIVVLGPG